MMRCFADSVTPPVLSSTKPPSAFVCWNSACDAYRMIGLRSSNSCCSSRDSRAYERSTMRAASSVASRSCG
jgi:hypothetical protein